MKNIKKSRKAYNDFYTSQGIKIESKDKDYQLYLMGTNLYVYAKETKCFIINDVLGLLFLKHFCSAYDDYSNTPALSQTYLDSIWDNFNNASELLKVKEKYLLTETGFETLKTSLIADIIRYKPREYVINEKIILSIWH